MIYIRRIYVLRGISDNKSPRRGAVAVLLVGALLSTGCIGLPSVVSNAESVGDAVHQRYESIDRYSATVTKTVETSTGTSHVRAIIMVDTDEEMRIVYQTGPRSGTVERLNISSTSATRPLLSTGLKQVCGGSTSYGALAAKLVRTSNVSLDRMTTLDGHLPETADVAGQLAAGSAELDEEIEEGQARREKLETVLTILRSSPWSESPVVAVVTDAHRSVSWLRLSR